MAVTALQVAFTAAIEAADATGGTDLLTPFLQLGAVGALALLLLTFARGAYQREAKRSDALEEELRRLHTDLRERFVPLMTEVTRVLAEAHSLLRERNR